MRIRLFSQLLSTVKSPHPVASLEPITLGIDNFIDSLENLILPPISIPIPKMIQAPVFYVISIEYSIIINSNICINNKCMILIKNIILKVINVIININLKKKSKKTNYYLKFRW
ncbi:MAG: hypothetical protein EU540_04775 [Promethearchaeota archaeon]|nr:MAG: hypothetical protein EU540_04775 [Candidatus Lokiarchaeota archaeon]